MLSSDFSHAYPGKLVDTPFGTKAFIPDTLPTSVLFHPSIRTAEENALLAIGELRTLPRLLPQHPMLFAAQYLRRESVLSSKIEGTSTKIGQLFLFEESGDDGRKGRQADSDTIEVYNAKTALENGLEEIEKKSITCSLLRGLNAILFKDVPESTAKFPGKFRPNQAFMGGGRDILKARYVAPPAMFVNELMSALETYVDTFLPINTLTKIALVHYQFEAIHPFEDGNGRIGRILISLMLKKYGLLSEPLLYLSAYFDRNKKSYVNKLWEVSSRSRWSEWITFFLDGVKEEANDALRRAHEIADLREAYRQRWNGTSAALKLIDDLFYRPALTINRAAKVMGRTTEAARTTINKLVKIGVLREVTGYKRNRRFIAPEIIQLLD